MAEFAGRTTVRMIDIGLVLRDRRPVDVFHTHRGLVPVNRTGRLDEDRYHAQMSEAMNNMWAPAPGEICRLLRCQAHAGGRLILLSPRAQKATREGGR